MLTEEEKQKVNDEAFDKCQEDLNSIIKKIIDKAAFVIKLNIPHKFKKKDITAADDGLKLIKAPSSFKDVGKPKLEWENRLKQWKQM